MRRANCLFCLQRGRHNIKNSSNPAPSPRGAAVGEHCATELGYHPKLRCPVPHCSRELSPNIAKRGESAARGPGAHSLALPAYDRSLWESNSYQRSLCTLNAGKCLPTAPRRIVGTGKGNGMGMGAGPNICDSGSFEIDWERIAARSS